MTKGTRKGEQHDCNADTGESSQEASPNGSEVSVRPDGSQELSSTLTSVRIKESQSQEQLSN